MREWKRVTCIFTGTTQNGVTIQSRFSKGKHLQNKTSPSPTNRIVCSHDHIMWEPAFIKLNTIHPCAGAHTCRRLGDRSIHNTYLWKHTYMEECTFKTVGAVVVCFQLRTAVTWRAGQLWLYADILYVTYSAECVVQVTKYLHLWGQNWLSWGQGSLSPCVYMLPPPCNTAMLLSWQGPVGFHMAQVNSSCTAYSTEATIPLWVRSSSTDSIYSLFGTYFYFITHYTWTRDHHLTMSCLLPDHTDTYRMYSERTLHLCCTLTRNSWCLYSMSREEEEEEVSHSSCALPTPA